MGASRVDESNVISKQDNLPETLGMQIWRHFMPYSNAPDSSSWTCWSWRLARQYSKRRNATGAKTHLRETSAVISATGCVGCLTKTGEQCPPLNPRRGHNSEIRILTTPLRVRHYTSRVYRHMCRDVDVSSLNLPAPSLVL